MVGCHSLKKELFLTHAHAGIRVSLLRAGCYNSWLPTHFCLKKHPCNDMNRQAGEEEAQRPWGGAVSGPCGAGCIMAVFCPELAEVLTKIWGSFN